MRRVRRVPPRTIIFIGCEGKSERAFVRLLSDLCQEAGLHQHLDAKPGNGGDSVSVVQEAGRHLRKHPDRMSIKHSFVLLVLASDHPSRTGLPCAKCSSAT